MAFNIHGWLQVCIGPVTLALTQLSDTTPSVAEARFRPLTHSASLVAGGVCPPNFKADQFCFQNVCGVH